MLLYFGEHGEYSDQGNIFCGIYRCWFATGGCETIGRLMEICEHSSGKGGGVYQNQTSAGKVRGVVQSLVILW